MIIFICVMLKLYNWVDLDSNKWDLDSNGEKETRLRLHWVDLDSIEWT